MKRWVALPLLLALGAVVGCRTADGERRRPIEGRSYRCQTVAGTFTNVFRTGEACAAQGAATCTEGTLEGDLRGTYAFAFDAQQPAGDTRQPSRQTFIGRSDLRLEDGSQLSGADFGDIVLSQQGESPFRTLIDLQGRSGPLAEARGHILARGAANLATGQGSGTYSGELCLPH